MTVQFGSRLQVVGSSHRAVRMVCTNPVTINDDVCAYVSGIKIGTSRIEGSFEPGDMIEYPVFYLPWVELPAEIRFVSERSGQEIAEPFRITTHDEAVGLVGLGEAVVQNVSIDQGVIRGLVINRTNGLLRPQMFARLNGVVPRVISVENPRILDDGGASFQFSAPLHPSDLGENGVTAEIFLLGHNVPLATVAFRRADIDDATKRIVELEARLAQLSQSTTVRLNVMTNDLQARNDMLQQRIDTFIEYTASFLFDRLAATEVPTVPDAAPLSPGLRAKIDAFLAVVRNGDQAQSGKSMDLTVSVPVSSNLFAFGWLEQERESDRAMRWMSNHAVIFNPHPDRMIAEVRLGLVSAGGVKPSLRASYDNTPVQAEIEMDRRRTGNWLVRITAPAADLICCRALNLADTRLTPGQNGKSTSGSLGVSEVTFVYAATDSQGTAISKRMQ